MSPSEKQPRSRRAAPAGRYRVAPGTQVWHDGRVHAEGETLDVPEHVAAPWLARGYVTDEQDVQQAPAA